VTETTADAVRAFILDFVSDGLRAKGLEPSDVDDSFDLLMEGAIDSFGILELIGELDRRFAVAIDTTEVDVDTLTTLGPLARHVAYVAAGV
jgi:acyl carrier protein